MTAPLRLLRLEIRRTPAWLMLPVVAVLLWIASPYGRTLRAPLVLWSARSVALPGALQVVGPFAAGIAAWVAGRDGRRRMTDLVACTSHPALGRRLATLAASTAVGLVLYVVATAVAFAVTARQGAWGGPLWLPVLVGALGVVTFSSLGFAIGALVPSRFTAPLVAIGFLFGLQLVLAAWYEARDGWAAAVPVVDSVDPTTVPLFGTGTGIGPVQLLLLSGVVLATAALSALREPSSAPATRAVAVTLAATGLLVVGGAVHLAGTLTRVPGRGAVIPSLATGTAVVPFTPVCDRSGPLPVCTHPAFAAVLAPVSADVAAVTAQFAGLPGAPTTIDMEVPATDRGAVRISAPNSQGPMSAAMLRYIVRADTAAGCLGLPMDKSGPDDAARRAVADGLLFAAGEQLPTWQAPTSQDQAIRDAGSRFAALAEPARRQWLADHLTALRAGTVTMGQLP